MPRGSVLWPLLLTTALKPHGYLGNSHHAVSADTGDGWGAQPGRPDCLHKSGDCSSTPGRLCRPPVLPASPRGTWTGQSQTRGCSTRPCEESPKIWLTHPTRTNEVNSQQTSLSPVYRRSQWNMREDSHSSRSEFQRWCEPISVELFFVMKRNLLIVA